MSASKKSGDDEHEDHGGSGRTIEIRIDNKEYTTSAKELTGTQIRALAQPPIGPERDLILEIPGPGDDRIIKDAEKVHLKNGMIFYSAPRDINPGS